MGRSVVNVGRNLASVKDETKKIQQTLHRFLSFLSRVQIYLRHDRLEISFYIFHIFFRRIEKQDVTIKDCIVTRKQVGRLFLAYLLHNL